MQGEGTLSRGFPQRPLPRPRAAEGRASARTGQQDRPEEQRGPQGPLRPASAGTDRHEGSTVSGWREPWGTGPCSRTARETLSTAPWQRAHRCLLCVVLGPEARREVGDSGLCFETWHHRPGDRPGDRPGHRPGDRPGRHGGDRGRSTEHRGRPRGGSGDAGRGGAGEGTPTWG